MKRYKSLLLVGVSIFLILTFFTGVSAAQSDYYYEYGKYSDNDTEYAEKKTVYDWLRGSYSYEVEEDSEDEESPEDPPEDPPEGTPDEDSEDTDSTTSSETTTDAVDTEEITTSEGSSETVNIDPFEDYAYPDVESYNMSGVYGLFSGGYFYPEAIQSSERIEENRSEEEVEESFKSVEERLQLGQYYKFDDRVYQEPPREAVRWNLYNGREYRNYTLDVGNIVIPEEDINEGSYEVSFPEAGSLETQVNYEGEEIEIPRDPFVKEIYLGIHSISNSQYVHEYRKENTVYDKTKRIIGSRGSVSNVLKVKTESISGVFTGLDVGDEYYAYSVWGESLKNSKVLLKQTTGTPTHDCLESGCDVTSGEYGEGWSVGYGRAGYNIPDKYVTPSEKFKFVLKGDIKVNIQRYTYVREKDGKECINWKFDTDEVDSEDNVCLEEEQDYKWAYKPDLTKKYEVTQPASEETESFEFQGGFEYSADNSIDTDSDYGDDIKIHKGLLPNDEYIYQVKTDVNYNRGIWKSIQANPDSRVYSGWHHFTSRNKGWDRMFETDYEEQEEFKWPWETGNDSGIHTSRIRPIEVHTYQHSNPHTTLSRGSDAFEIRDYQTETYKEKDQALLDYHSSCWVEQPEDEASIDKQTPEELRQCNWTHTAKNVGFTDKEDDSKQFYTGEYRKDAYVPHERITSVLFHSNKPYNGFIINGLANGVLRYDTVDTTREVRELRTKSKEIDSVEDIPVDICSPGNITDDCVVNPDTAGYDVYEVELEESLSESIVTTNKEGINKILIEDGLSADDVTGSSDSETVDSTAVLGPNDKHYLTVNTKVTPQVVRLRTDAVNWTDLDTEKQAYVSTSTKVQAEGDPKTDNVLQTVIRFSVVLWIIVEMLNRFFTIIGFRDTNVGKFMYDTFIPTKGIRFIMTIGLFILVLDYFYGGFF